MPSYVSPGVYIQERDYSAYVAAGGSTATGFVISAQRGPLDTPTLVTTGEEFIATFGDPSANHFGPHGVLNYLQSGNQAWVCRVARQYTANAAAIVDMGDAVEGKVYSLVVEAGHTLNEGDYVRVTQTGKRSSQNLLIDSIDADGGDYLVTFDSPLLDTYDDSGTSDSSVAVSAGGAGAAPAEVFAFGRRNGQVFPLVKFTAKDPGSFANFGTGLGIEIQIEDGGRFQNVDPVSGLPITSVDGIPLQGMMPSAPSVDTKIALLQLLETARVGETRGVNYDSIVGTVDVVDSTSTGLLQFQIPLSDEWDSADGVVISGTGAYDGTYSVSGVSHTSTNTLISVTAFGGTLPGLRASTVLTSNNTNVADGVTVAIGSKTYTFRTTLTPTEGEVLIGADADGSLLNLIRAINHTGTPGTDYSTAAAHPQVTAASSVTAHAFAITALAGGTAGNSIATTDSSATLSFTGATLAGGTAAATVTGFAENTEATHRFGTVYRCATGGSGKYWTPEGVLTKRVRVLYKGNVVEIFDNVVGFDSTSPYYWDTVIGTAAQPVSQYVTAQYLGTSGEQPLSSYNRIKHPNNPRVVMGLPSQVRISDSPSAAISSFTNPKGYDGDSPSAADYIGTISDDGRTGLQCFRQVAAYPIDLLAVPGVSLPSVIVEMIAIAEARHDALVLIDPPLGLNVQDVVDWHNGTGPYSGLHAAFVSNKAALFYPWVRVYDPYTKRNLMLPPSCLMPGIIAASDAAGEAWFAPAGITRGKVRGALAAERILDQGDLDYMYGPGNGNAVNGIATFARDGITVWGQRTLQRHPSALDRINVRRLLFYIERQVQSAVRVLAFEANDPILWSQFTNLVSPMLQNLVGRRAIENFAVVCDASTNTPARRNNNELYAKVIVTPVKTAEKLIIDLTILPSGVSVTEFAAGSTGVAF